MNFVSSYPAMLRVDRSKFPPYVELQGDEWEFLTKKVDTGTGNLTGLGWIYGGQHWTIRAVLNTFGITTKMKRVHW